MVGNFPILIKKQNQHKRIREHPKLRIRGYPELDIENKKNYPPHISILFTNYRMSIGRGKS